MPSNPKVAVITPGSFVIPSGHSSSVERVIEKVVPLSADQLDIRIFGVSNGQLPRLGQLGAVPCYRMPGDERYLAALLKHFKKWNPDVIDVHNRPLLASQLRTRLPTTKVILTLHSTTFLTASYRSALHLKQQFSQSDQIVVNSQYLKAELERRLGSACSPIVVNPLGVSLEDFTPRWTPVGESLRKARLADLGWSSQKIILFIGRLLPSKGVHHLLHAMPFVLKHIPNAMLVIVGSAYYGVDRESPYVRQLRLLAKPLQDRVVFVPFVPYPKVADWYNLADVVAVPSGAKEAFGLVNVEAMAAAVPVVAARKGGIPEVVSDGESGLLLAAPEIHADLARKLVLLLENEERQKRMGQAGRELARRKFRWHHTADRWVRIIKGNIRVVGPAEGNVNG